MAPLDRVTERFDRVLIVASGPSAEELDLNLVQDARAAGVYVLAVNRTWEWCTRIDGWFTLDPDKYVIRYLFDRDCGVTRYVAIPDDYGREDADVYYHRNMPLFPEVVYLRRISGGGRLGSRYGLSTDVSTVHTGNSAYGALGIAKHMGARKIGLIGVDGNKNLGYAHRLGKPKGQLVHLPRLFATATTQLHSEGIQVQNGSPGSLVKCFVRHPPNAVVKWLMEEYEP